MRSHPAGMVARGLVLEKLRGNGGGSAGRQGVDLNCASTYPATGSIPLKQKAAGNPAASGFAINPKSNGGPPELYPNEMPKAPSLTNVS